MGITGHIVEFENAERWRFVPDGHLELLESAMSGVRTNRTADLPGYFVEILQIAAETATQPCELCGVASGGTGMWVADSYDAAHFGVPDGHSLFRVMGICNACSGKADLQGQILKKIGEEVVESHTERSDGQIS